MGCSDALSTMVCCSGSDAKSKTYSAIEVEVCCSSVLSFASIWMTSVLANTSAVLRKRRAPSRSLDKILRWC